MHFFLSLSCLGNMILDYTNIRPAVKTNGMVVSVFSGHMHTCTNDTILIKSILKFR